MDTRLSKWLAIQMGYVISTILLLPHLCADYTKEDLRKSLPALTEYLSISNSRKKKENRPMLDECPSATKKILGGYAAWWYAICSKPRMVYDKEGSLKASPDINSLSCALDDRYSNWSQLMTELDSILTMSNGEVDEYISHDLWRTVILAGCMISKKFGLGEQTRFTIALGVSILFPQHDTTPLVPAATIREWMRLNLEPKDFVDRLCQELESIERQTKYQTDKKKRDDKKAEERKQKDALEKKAKDKKRRADEEKQRHHDMYN